MGASTRLAVLSLVNAGRVAEVEIDPPLETENFDLVGRLGPEELVLMTEEGELIVLDVSAALRV